MNNKKIKTHKAKIRHGEDGFHYIRIHSGSKITIDDAREIITTIAKLSKKEKIPVLSDIGEN